MSDTLDEVEDFEWKGYAWKNEILDAIGGDLKQITKDIGLRLGSAMKQSTVNIVASAKPELEVSIRVVVSELLRLADKHVAQHNAEQLAEE